MEVDVKNIFKFVYLFYVKHHARIHTDAEWIEIMNEAKEIEKQYSSEHAKNMLVETMSQLEREEKELINNEYDGE